MKKIPLVQLVTESLELCTQCDCESHLRWKIRPRSHFFSEDQWRIWNQHHAGRLAGEVMQDENGEIYCLVEIQLYTDFFPRYLWAERVHYMLLHNEDHPAGDNCGGFYRKDQE